MIHFGIGTMNYGGVPIGHLQSVNIDISFTTAQLYSGGEIFPIDVRTHTGQITGSAEFADLTAVSFEKLLGGTRSNSSIALDSLTYPSTFELVCTMTTDGLPLTITFNKCRSTKLAMAFQRDQHVIPNFDFEVQQDASGNVATIEIGDVS